MKNPLESLFKNLKLMNKDSGKPTKIGYVILIGLLGLLFLVAGNVFNTSSKTSNEDSFTPLENKQEQQQSQETAIFKDEEPDKDPLVANLEKSYEKQLKDILEQIKGVSDVDVMVNLESTNSKVYEKNLVISKQTTQEEDQKGGQRQVEDYSKDEQVVLVRQGDKEVPLLVQTQKPSVKGVLIVAKGADHMEVKKWIVEAVSRVLGVPSHRVSVMPKQ